MVKYDLIDGNALVEQIYFPNPNTRKTTATVNRAIGISVLAATVHELAGGMGDIGARSTIKRARESTQTLATDIASYLERNLDLDEDTRHWLELFVRTLEGLSTGAIEAPIDQSYLTALDDMSQQALAKANIRAFY